jgi:hypothetical protein
VHPFGCIQSGKKAKKWEVRARVAIYLGPSPQHARTVGLVLSPTTGLVSPQFHVKYDDTFSTLRNNSMPKSMWQQLAGFAPDQTSKIRALEKSSIPTSEYKGVEQNDEQADNEQEQDQLSVHGYQNDDPTD